MQLGNHTAAVHQSALNIGTSISLDRKVGENAIDTVGLDWIGLDVKPQRLRGSIEEEAQQIESPPHMLLLGAGWGMYTWLCRTGPSVALPDIFYTPNKAAASAAGQSKAEIGRCSPRDSPFVSYPRSARRHLLDDEGECGHCALGGCA